MIYKNNVYLAKKISANFLNTQILQVFGLNCLANSLVSIKLMPKVNKNSIYDTFSTNLKFP